jgi:hypothetical protein
MGLDASRAKDLADRLGGALVAQKTDRLGVVLDAESFLDRAKTAKAKDPVTCGGNTACAVAIGKAAAVDQVIALQFVAVGTSLAVDGRVLEVAGGAVLATVTATLPAAPSDAELGELARKMVAQLKPVVAVAEKPPEPLKVPEPLKTPDLPPPPPPPTDRPIASVTPPLVPAPGVVAQPVGPVSGKPAAIGLGVGAVLAGGAALLIVGRNRLAAVDPASPDAGRDRTVAKGFSMGANLGFAAAGVLLTGAVAAWLLTPETPPASVPTPVEKDVATFE